MTSTLTTCPTTRSTGSSCSPTFRRCARAWPQAAPVHHPGRLRVPRRDQGEHRVRCACVRLEQHSPGGMHLRVLHRQLYLGRDRRRRRQPDVHSLHGKSPPPCCLSFSLLTSLFFSQVGHLHVGGIDVTLYDDDTGEVICRSEAIYGNGTEAGNENGYLIGMTPCSFLTPPVFPKNKKVRTVARYNNTEPHTGVMGLMLSTMYEVPA